MRLGLGIVALFLAAYLVLAQKPDLEQEGLPSTDTELRAVAMFLQKSLGKTHAEADLPYLRFFTTYDVPEKILPAVERSLSFALNSAASVNSRGFIVKPKPVPGHPSLWWIDIRKYGWSPEQFELISKQDPFFSEPLVDHRIYNFTRLLAGNVLFRADWFIYNTLDATKQEDRGEKNIIYYLLLYGIGKEAKDSDEFRKAWQVDIDTIRVQDVERGTLVEAGESGVSIHTRQLRHGRTIFGDYNESRDVKTHDADIVGGKVKSRDFIEDIFANQYDASEYISSHKNGLQVYFLSQGPGGKFKRIESADNGIVVDRSDTIDPRVRTPKSCIVCHSKGLIPSSNAIAEIFRAGGDIHARNEKLAEKIESFYLQDLNEIYKASSVRYEKAVFQCNGRTGTLNAKDFVTAYEWYRGKVTVEQAAIECGLSVKEFKRFISATATGRLTRLYHGHSIPRDVWDSVNAGGYIQSQLLIKRIEIKPPPPPVKEEAKIQTKAVLLEGGSITDQKLNALVYLEKGSVVQIVEKWDDNYLIVRSGGIQGFLPRYKIGKGGR